MIRICTLVFALAMATAAACDAIDTSRAEVGGPAPDYGSVTLDGDSVRLDGLRGTVVLLNVWATWCAPCREEIPALQALYEQNRERGFEVVGVSVDGRGDREAIRRFAREFNMTYPIWHDPEDVFGLRFRTVGVPVTFVIDRAGVIRWRHMGPVVITDPGLNRALEEAFQGE